MKVNGIEFEAKWTDDSQGKKDFDFNVIHVSTRYWPDHTARPTIWFGDKKLFSLLDNEYIEGETEKECKEKVERWIRLKLHSITEALSSHF